MMMMHQSSRMIFSYFVHIVNNNLAVTVAPYLEVEMIREMIPQYESHIPLALIQTHWPLSAGLSIIKRIDTVPTFI